MADSSLHKGHRLRKKQQFLEHGLETFQEHEALELLLYYAIPRADTNPTAHKLLDHFGTLEEVLCADVEELKKVPGVGENTALLISLVLPLARLAHLSTEAKATILKDSEDAGTYFMSRFRGERNECFLEACVDAKGKLLRCPHLSRGCADSVDVSLRQVAWNALCCGATGVYLSHNHPSGVALPSQEDSSSTLVFYEALRSIGVRLLDHIIVADNDYVSMKDSGLIPR